jgi:hypothetical protein
MFAFTYPQAVRACLELYAPSIMSCSELPFYVLYMFRTLSILQDIKSSPKNYKPVTSEL